MKMNKQYYPEVDISKRLIGYQKTIRDAEYIMMLERGRESDVLDQLNAWLADWLYAKDNCPCCWKVR